MKHKMPYYMAYPELDYVDEDKMCRRDAEYMRSIYPQVAKAVWPFIQQECDRLEYDGSLIYDEYPDKLMLRLMCGRVYRNALEHMDQIGFYIKEEECHWFGEMIEIMVYQELCKRREKWRTNKRRWY